jgi:hypothetical protein
MRALQVRPTHSAPMHTHSECNNELMEHRGSCRCCRKCPNCYDYTRLFHDDCDDFFDYTHFSIMRIPHSMRLFGRSRRPEAGRRRWVPDVVGQLVGIGPWDGPVTCNESHSMAALAPAGRKVPREHDAAPCWGHAMAVLGPSALAALRRF